MSSRFQSEQWIAAPLPQVFAFFSDPHNLPHIMPPGLGAKLVKLNLVPPRAAEGQVAGPWQQMAGAGTEMVIAFRVIPYVPIHERWVVRITEFAVNEYFCDTQEQGPFRRWEHVHHFEVMSQGGRKGTLVRDEIEFEVGFGVVGTLLETALFQRMFRSVFAYRRKALEGLFPATSKTAAVR